MIEIWRDIKGFEGYYQISNLGNIKGLDRKVKSSKSKSGFRLVKSKPIATHIDKYGYVSVRLRKEGKTKAFTIHRLVAIAFIPNPNNYPSINHIDENKLNNNVQNLEWCTVRYNNLYNNRQKKINKKLQLTNKNSKAVLQYTLNGKLLKEFISIKDAARKTGINRKSISDCCRGILKIGNGFVWKFK